MSSTRSWAGEDLEGLREAVAVFYDPFRVQHGKLAEHWDVVFAKPQALRHHNGII